MNYINIGKIVASFGVEGELILLHGFGKKINLTGVSALFVEQIKGNYLPYFIVNSKGKDHTEMYVKLEGVTTKEAVKPLLHKQVWLTDADFRKIAPKNTPIALLGFSLYNEEQLIGTIDEVIEQPHQVLLQIMYKGKEALIPLHAETLDKIDHANKKVFVTLPDGLLEIYE